MGRFREELGWLLGDIASLALIVMFMPLLPVFFLIGDLGKLHEVEGCDGPD